jgi:hypothetical protein
MASNVAGTLSRVPWRVIGWGAAVALLALPFVAMQFTPEVNWTGSDFVVFGGMLLMVAIPLELVARLSPNWWYRGGSALALLGMFLTIWANLAVGIVGSEHNANNVLFFGALLTGILGACVARFGATGMAYAMVATATALEVAFAIAVSGPTDEPFVPHVREFIGTTIFAALFVGSAALFRRAGQAQSA